MKIKKIKKLTKRKLKKLENQIVRLKEVIATKSNFKDNEYTK